MTIEHTPLVIPPDDLRLIQFVQLEMILEVKRICELYHIQYCIIAGTLLGAVRHKGFIPWDDDADVALLRGEYERFCRACEKDLDTSRFVFQDHRHTRGYRWGYGKMRRLGTAFVRAGQEHMPYFSGIFIDIFPLDGVPEGAVSRFFHNLHCTLIRKILWSPVGAKTAGLPPVRWLFALLAKIPDHVVFQHFERFIQSSNNRPSGLVRILTFPTPNRLHAYYKRWYEQLAPYSFEGHRLCGVADYDDYLGFKYGDYMRPPPVPPKQHPVSCYAVLPRHEIQIGPVKGDPS